MAKNTTVVDVAGMQKILDRQKAAFLAQGAPEYKQRISDLDKLAQAIRLRVDTITDAIATDFGSRSRHEILIAEIHTTLSAIHYIKKNLKAWMKPQKRSVNAMLMPGKAKVIMAPLGVVGIISPWNYPLYLSMVPVITALAAGNRVMLKPSAFTPRTSQVMKEMFADIFKPDQMSVIFSGPGIGSAFSTLAFDHLCFTGSTSVGRVVMEAASKNLTPVTLELGGKSPVIIGKDYDLAKAADLICMGKLFNSGQTCVAPDHALVPADKVDQFVDQYVKIVKKRFPTIANNPDYTSIITERHHKRLNHGIEDARKKGAKIVVINPANESFDAKTKKIPPTLVLNGSDDMILLSDEIFGPILPIIPYDSLDKAIAYVNNRPRPLALYFFSDKKPWIDRVLEKAWFGGGCINNTLLHVAQDDLPFGGVGPSGMGLYHGKEGFETFSHKKEIFHQKNPNAQFALRPPYTKALEKLIRLMIRY